MSYEWVIIKILTWYKKHKRTLPWRKTRNPYNILVSEVMLQQTQVDRVVPKYKEFLKQFSSIRALAVAKPSDVIKAWAGLGYNRRALYLQKTAQAVVSLYKGKFPRDLELLKELPGVGDYTARAILSFAFDQPVAVLDTNHRKFYQRTFFGENLQRDKMLLKKAEEIIPRINLQSSIFNNQFSVVYHWNQALMDFMSAVARHAPEVTWYEEAFPVAPKKTKPKNLQVKFELTDRYARGKIIDGLRERHRIRPSTLRSRFPHIGKERLERIVLGLEKDGLIRREKGYILLP